PQLASALSPYTTLFRSLKKKIGQTITVLIDEVSPDGAIARSAADAPEIDGRVIIRQGAKLKVGEFTRVKITKSDTHDLWATPSRSEEHTSELQSRENLV